MTRREKIELILKVMGNKYTTVLMLARLTDEEIDKIYNEKIGAK